MVEARWASIKVKRFAGMLRKVSGFCRNVFAIVM